MFERTLQDLIRGLRAHKTSSKVQEDAFLAEAMGEIRDELKGKDMALKAEGVVKMCYLLMLYPIPPPPGFAFHVVEIMSSPRYHLKQLGYLASPMAFSGDTEEVVLTVNGIKKDLMSPHLALPPLPLTALPHLLSLSSSLSHTLHPDLLHLLSHSTPRIRKRAVLCLLPCWEAFPEGLREGFPRLRERLSDDDQSVVGATIGVVMELARRQGGRNYLPLAPELFAILTGSSNNWILIKVVKLFAILTPLETRLVRKLLPPITSLISSTSAISLLYECVRTCIVGGMLDPDRAEGEALARVCVEKLGGYLRDEGGDQNLRYIALLAMVKIIPTHPQMVAEYQEEVLQSLDDPDVSIRMRALELLTSMVDRYNLRSIVDQLLAHLAPPQSSATSTLPSAAASLAAVSGATSPPATDPTSTSSTLSLTPAYRLLLTQRLLGIIAHDTYVNVTGFEWVISVLVDVSYVSNVDVGAEVRDMLLDVMGRVKSVRAYAVKILEKVLGDEDFRARGREKTGEDGLLEAAVWVCGEYASELSSPLSAISSVLSPTLHISSTSLIRISLQSAAKIFGHHVAKISSSWSADLYEQTKHLVPSVRDGLRSFTTHPEIEAQERAAELLVLLSFVEADLAAHNPPKANGFTKMHEVQGGFEDSNHDTDLPYPKSLFLFEPLFTAHELNAVAYKAQESVRIPEGLDLERDIVPGGGFMDIDGDEVEEESEAEKGLDLGEGGGAGMDELRRVLREQDEQGRSRTKKGKGKKKNGEVMTVEEREAKERRKAARRAKAKDDPYYLYDEKEEPVEDVEDIPMVQLEDGELGDGALAESAPARKPRTGKSKIRQSLEIKPPEFDRSGEMPDGAPPLTTAPLPREQLEKTRAGLAAVDLLGDPPQTSRTTSFTRFEEYQVDDADEKVDMAPVGGEVEVVRVRRKKKSGKEGKKKVEKA